MARQRGGAPPANASRPAPDDGGGLDEDDERNAREGIGADVPDADDDGVTDPGYESPDRDSDDDDDDSRDYPNPIAGDDPAQGRDSGEDLGGEVSDADRRRAAKQRRAAERAEALDPTAPDSPGGTTVGSRETQRYLAAVQRAGGTVAGLDERGALAAQVERATGVDARSLGGAGSSSRVGVDLDLGEGVFRAGTETDVPATRRRRQAAATQQTRGGPSVSQARNAVEGLGIGSGFGTGRRTQSEDVASLANTTTPAGIAATSRRNAALTPSRLPSAVDDVENALGIDIPGSGPVATPVNTEGERFGDIDFSFGLGDPEEDEVESFADSLPGRARDATEGPAEQLFSEEVAGESAIAAGLRAAGRDELADTVGDEVRATGVGVTSGTAEAVAGLPGVALEATELAANAVTYPGQTGRDLPDAALQAGVSGAEGALANPGRSAGGVLGGAAAGAGFGRFLGTTRVGSGTSGRVLNAVDIDPASSTARSVRRFIDDDRAQADGGLRLRSTDSDSGGSGGDGIDMDAINDALERFERGTRTRAAQRRARERVREEQASMDPPGPRSVTRREATSVSAREFRTVSRDGPTGRSGPTAAEASAGVGRRFDADSDLSPREAQLAAQQGQRTALVDLRNVAEDVFTPEGVKVNQVGAADGVTAGQVISAGSAASGAVSGASARLDAAGESSLTGAAVDESVADGVLDGVLSGTGTDTGAAGSADTDVFSRADTDVFGRTRTGTDTITRPDSRPRGLTTPALRLTPDPEFSPDPESDPEGFFTPDPDPDPDPDPGPDPDPDPGFPFEDDPSDGDGFGSVGFGLSDEVFDTGVIQSLDELEAQTQQSADDVFRGL